MYFKKHASGYLKAKTKRFISSYVIEKCPKKCALWKNPKSLK